MSSSGLHVTVSPDSQVIVFSGNLLKAPPLNRRGRKKWHERYFLLRANKTIEIHKSRKAAEAQKTPRRVIDLRECISLELGLEYKNLQHILSLGTFERTFFLAAPSNALMLQWGNVLEKVKSAESGEAIEVLDIGLKNIRNCNAVHRVKPSESPQPFLSSTSQEKLNGTLYQKGVSKSSYALSSLCKEAHDGVYGNRGSGNIGYTSYYTSPNNQSSSLSNQKLYGREHTRLSEFHGRLYGYPRMRDTSVETVDLRERGRLSSSSSSSGPSPSHVPLGKIPPPNMLKGRRGASNEGSPKHSSREGSSVQGDGDIRRGNKRRRANSKDSVVRESLLRRSEAFRAQGSKVSSPTEGDFGGIWKGGRSNGDGGARRKGRLQNDTDVSSLLHAPLKHSHHYRKIELQAEKPLFGLREDDEGSSDEEMDSIVSEATGKSSPGIVPMSSSAGKPFQAYPSPLSVSERLELYGRRRNYSGPPISARRSGGYGYLAARSREILEMGGRGYMRGSGGSGWTGSGSGWGNSSPFIAEVGRYSPCRPEFLSRPPHKTSETSKRFYSLESLERNMQEERANKYCQVTVGERDEDAVSEITSSKAGIAHSKLNDILRKSSADLVDYDIQLPSPNPSSTYEEEIRDREGEFAQEDQQQRNTEKHFSDTFDGSIQLSPPSSPLFDEFDKDFQLLTAVSESFLYRLPGSMKSPVNEIIAPPLSFDDDTILEEGEPQTSDKDRTGSDIHNSKSTADRHSTESYDTGYTSGQGQSPGINERMNLTTVEEFMPTPGSDFPSPSAESERSPSPTAQDTLSVLSASSVRNSPSGYSIRHSQISYASTDSIRFYVPLVFQKSGKAPKHGRTSSKRSLFLIVCLVENSDNVIKELLSQKSARGYHAVECEGEMGKSVVSAGDDFTVETALEDLEFGFSITTSTQKDVYINRAKVREFQFQIDHLFGSGKPFSCDVKIRHADQITVLPNIEIEMAE